MFSSLSSIVRFLCNYFYFLQKSPHKRVFICYNIIIYIFKEEKRMKKMPKWIKILCLILVISFFPIMIFVLATAETRYFDGDAETYYQELLAQGFPEDYAYSLTELHLLHPEWSFTPLLITEQNPLYRWDYIIEQETKDADTNLISASNTYRAYHHETNKATYDSGYYQASRASVEYFMDPRNFLNETDIFQFYDLSATHSVGITEISAVLDGTFMADAVLENGKTYAEYFLEVGQELGVNPVYLAVKARQEQGVSGSSPILDGTCGSLLAEYYQNGTQTSESGKNVLAPTEGFTTDELLELNGYYNLYNIKASGNGLFTIYYNAMKRAQEGSEHMTDAWGSPAWNTLWKSLYGGAYTIKTSFIDRYQNTIYLQKFNVDSRAADRNFWGQYMQNVAGSLTESRTLFGAFASSGVLDGPCSFVIPVYEGIPQDACADPANGTCSYLAAANKKYESSVFFSSPFLIWQTNTFYDAKSVYADGTLHLRGMATHSYGVARIEYRWDDGEWLTLCEGDSFDQELAIPFAVNTSHMLTLRAIANYDHSDSSKKSNWSVLLSVFYIDVVERPKINISLTTPTGTTTLHHYAGMELVLPTCEDANFMGWYSSNNTLVPSGSTVTPTENTTYTALYMRFEQMSGAALVFPEDETHLRFYAAAESSILEKLSQSDAEISFLATVIHEDGTEEVTPVLLRGTDTAFDTTWQVLSADTLPIEEDHYDRIYSMRFWAVCYYSDGTVKTFLPDGIYCNRSAAEVAHAALSDTTVQYDSHIVEHLTQIVSATTV